MGDFPYVNSVFLDSFDDEEKSFITVVSIHKISMGHWFFCREFLFVLERTK